LKIQIVELEDLSGAKTGIYSIIVDAATECLYDLFVQSNIGNNKKEVLNFDDQLMTIGQETGIREGYFKTGIGHDHQHICEFKDRPRAKLRLFFIEHMQKNVIIVGGGGVKPKSARTIEEVPALNRERLLLMEIEDILLAAEKAGTFTILPDGTLNSTTNFIYSS
jgi:hypothetical protein